MANYQNSQTAYFSAYARLIEQYEPPELRLFDDLLAKCFFSNYISILMRSRTIRKFLIFIYNIVSTGILGLQVCRTKYIDGKLKEAMDQGIEQIVILGAGFDTRPYRLVSKSIRVFELDLPDTQDKKEKVIQKCLGSLPKNVIYIPIDFNIKKLEDALLYVLDYSKRVFFIWEGVTQYISEEAVKETLKYISEALPGSELLFTYIVKSAIDDETNFLINSLENLSKIGGITIDFRLNPSEVGNFIEKYNLMLIEEVGKSYYQENYLKPLGRTLNISIIERLVYARII